MAFSQMVDAQIGVLRHGEQFDVFALHPNRGKKTYLRVTGLNANM